MDEFGDEVSLLDGVKYGIWLGRRELTQILVGISFKSEQGFQALNMRHLVIVVKYLPDR